MNHNVRTLLAGVFSVALVAAAAPVLAQQVASNSTSAVDQKAPSGRLEKYHGAFRASELVGATVYNDQGNSIGKINDLLMDASGKADSAVLSVGGFLGIDSKYVDVSFDQLKIEPSRNTPAATTETTTTRTTTTTTTAPTAPGMSANAPAATAPAGGSASPSATQYYSLVLPGATKDSLNAMPSFKYAS